MPASIYDTYAAKICRFFDMPAGRYAAAELSRAVLQLPLAEAHAALDGLAHAALPRLGETLSLQEHAQRCFFDAIGMAGRQLFETTAPILVRQDHLERLEGWRDWRTLTLYLAQEGLEPALVFRNTPLRLHAGTSDQAIYYVADMRVMLGRTEPFAWPG